MSATLRIDAKKSVSAMAELDSKCTLGKEVDNLILDLLTLSKKNEQKTNVVKNERNSKGSRKKS